MKDLEDLSRVVNDIILTITHVDFRPENKNKNEKCKILNAL